LIVGHETVKLEKHTPPDFKRRLITSGTEIVIIQATPERRMFHNEINVFSRTESRM
jgi:hypothetical protein